MPRNNFIHSCFYCQFQCQILILSSIVVIVTKQRDKMYTHTQSTCCTVNNTSCTREKCIMHQCKSDRDKLAPFVCGLSVIYSERFGILKVETVRNVISSISQLQHENLIFLLHVYHFLTSKRCCNEVQQFLVTFMSKDYLH